MLQHISIAGLGPHETFSAELEPSGTSVLAGASETGKTTMLDGLLLALWGGNSRGGLEVGQIRDGHDEATVELALADGRVIRRAFNRERRQVRTIRTGTILRTFTSEKAFQEALAELGRDPETARLVVCPMAWAELLDKKGRPLRDALSRILPRGDTAGEVRARMAEQGFSVSDAEAAASDRQIEAWRKDTRDRMHAARGQVTYLEQRVHELAGVEVDATPDTLDAARATLTQAAAWDAWERANRGQALGRRAAEDLRAWEARRATLGDEPPRAEARLEAAREAEQLATQRLRGLMEEATTERARLDLARSELASLEAAGDTCPTCERPAWNGAAQRISRSRETLAEREAQLGAIIARGQAARTAHQQARLEVEVAQTARAAHDSWQAGIAALGPAPFALAGTHDVALSPPSEACPDATAIALAREAVEAGQAHEGARRQRAAELETARADLATALAAMTEAEALGERLDALRDAVRAAPSEVARRQTRALGELGPVSLVFGEDPAIEVLIDGRPWWLASRGRQVVADLWLRAGLRRALDLPQLPIVVDNVQDVGGQPLPSVDGPLILLRTTHDRTLVVSRG